MCVSSDFFCHVCLPPASSRTTTSPLSDHLLPSATKKWKIHVSSTVLDPSTSHLPTLAADSSAAYVSRDEQKLFIDSFPFTSAAYVSRSLPLSLFPASAVLALALVAVVVVVVPDTSLFLSLTFFSSSAHRLSTKHTNTNSAYARAGRHTPRRPVRAPRLPSGRAPTFPNRAARTRGGPLIARPAASIRTPASLPHGLARLPSRKTRGTGPVRAGATLYIRHVRPLSAS